MENEIMNFEETEIMDMNEGDTVKGEGIGTAAAMLIGAGIAFAVGAGVKLVKKGVAALKAKKANGPVAEEHEFIDIDPVIEKNENAAK